MQKNEIDFKMQLLFFFIIAKYLFGHNNIKHNDLIRK